MFYPPEDFDAQMVELLQKGLSDQEAYMVVRSREKRDKAIYDLWLEESADQLHSLYTE